MARSTPGEGARQSECIVRRLRQTRADMLGTDDEDHYWACHEAAAEIERLREAIRRLAEQDATLSVQGGSVTVTMEGTLTDAEWDEIEGMVSDYQEIAEFNEERCHPHYAEKARRRAAMLIGLLERLG